MLYNIMHKVAGHTGSSGGACLGAVNEVDDEYPDGEPRQHLHTRAFTDDLQPRGGFIPAETLVLTGTAGDNDTAGEY